MLARHLFIVPFFLMVLFLAACAAPASAPDGSASNGGQPAPTAHADSKFPALAQAEQVEQEQQVVEELDCLTNADLDDIRNEHLANPYRAADRYVGEQICLTGRITRFHKGSQGDMTIDAAASDQGNALDWNVRVPDFGGYVASGMSLVRMREQTDWETLFMEASVGDEIRAECQITSIADGPEFQGRPVLEGCLWISGTEPVISRPPASAQSGTKALTWELGVWVIGPRTYRLAVSLSVPSGWEWYDPYDRPEEWEPSERFLKPPGSDLPLVIVERNSAVYDVDELENRLYHDGFEVVGFEGTKTETGNDYAILATYTLSGDNHSEWVAYVHLDKRIRGNANYGSAVRCHAEAGDSRGRAECMAVIESVRLD